MDQTDIAAAWDYRDPAGSEGRFRSLIPDAEASGDAGLRVELLSQLARAICLQRRYGEALAVLDEAVPLLPAAGRPRVRWLLERGRILNDTDRTEEALALFRDARDLATEAGETLLEADALHMLACVSRGEENLRWHRVALDFCRANDAPRFRRWAYTLHTNMADEYERQGDFATGLRSVERALAIAGDLGLEDAARGSRVFLARLHRLGGDLHRARQVIEAAFDPGDPKGWAHEEYAECLLAAGRAEESRSHFRRAFELLSADPWFPPGERERLARLRRLGGEERN